MMAHVTVLLLGTWQLRHNEQPITGLISDKARALLAYLAVEKRPFRREHLAGLLWPTQTEKQARANLRRALSNLRHVLKDDEASPPHFRTNRQIIQLNPDGALWVDAVAFAEAITAGDPASLARAVELAKDHFLSGFSIPDAPAFESWLLLKREQIQRDLLTALQQLTHYHTQRGEYHQALAYAWQQVEQEPWQETAQRQLLRLLALTGQRQTAVAHFAAYEEAIATEFGVSVEAATQQLIEQIEQGLPLWSTASSPPQTVPTPPAHPFVNRQPELKQLQHRLKQALAGDTHITFLAGEAGSGKTALLQAFAHQAQQQQPGLVVCGSSSQAYTSSGDPYHLFRQVIRQLLGVEQPCWPADGMMHNRLSQAVTKLLSLPPPQSAQQLNLFANVQGHDAGSTPLSQPTLFAQIAHFFREITAVFPLLLLLDDLQWADHGSLNLLFHIGHHCQALPLLIVAAYRPEDLIPASPEQQRHPLLPIVHELTRVSGYQPIVLNGQGGRPFIDAWLDREPNKLDEAFRQQLHHQTNGQPLFTIELLELLREQGMLVKDANGCWMATDSIAWEHLPVRTEAIIAERNGRLPPRLQTLLVVASIQGSCFNAELVAHILAQPLPQIVYQFSQELGRIHNLVEPCCHKGALNPLCSYRFRHGLCQAYVYGQLDEAERVAWHTATAEAIATLYDDDTVAHLLAHHFEKAHQFEKAIAYRQRAGCHAAKLAAVDEAQYHYKQALTLLAQLPPTPMQAQKTAVLQEALAQLQPTKTKQANTCS